MNHLENTALLQETKQPLNENTNTNVDQQDNSNSYEIERLENSPFTLIKRDGKWIAALGMHVVVKEPKNTKEEVIEYLDSKPWEVIMTIYVAMKKIDEQTEEFNKQFSK